MKTDMLYKLMLCVVFVCCAFLSARRAICVFESFFENSQKFYIIDIAAFKYQAKIMFKKPAKVNLSLCEHILFQHLWNFYSEVEAFLGLAFEV